MRYSVSSPNLTPQQIEVECKKAGATNIVLKPLVRQVLCNLTEEQVKKLSILRVKELKDVRAAVISAPTLSDEAVAALAISDTFAPLRDYYSPPLTGTGLTVAVLDSGIRGTHEGISGRVVLQENFSSSPLGDIYDHGTNVASLIVAISPMVSLMDIKVLNDKGLATEEEVISGIERVCSLVEEAKGEGLHFTDPLFPNVINLSLGDEDDGDYDNPLRSATRVAKEDYGLEIIASAGNSGPNLSTVTNPACDPSVIAVGGIADSILEVWERSSRGPSLLGDVKPDFVTWAVGVEVASSKSDSAYEIKSGTSFAAPILSGVKGLLGEITRRAYGEQYDINWYVLKEVAPFFCIKAEGAAVVKDNHWGYGFPQFGSIARELSRVPAVGVGEIMADIMPIMAIAMLGMVMIPIVKTF